MHKHKKPHIIMNESFAIQLFEGKKVRIVWDAEQEKYYFSVTDIVQVLTDSVNPRDYIKKMHAESCDNADKTDIRTFPRPSGTQKQMARADGNLNSL